MAIITAGNGFLDQSIGNITGLVVDLPAIGVVIRIGRRQLKNALVTFGRIIGSGVRVIRIPVPVQLGVLHFQGKRNQLLAALLGSFPSIELGAVRGRVVDI